MRSQINKDINFSPSTYQASMNAQLLSKTNSRRGGGGGGGGQRVPYGSNNLKLEKSSIGNNIGMFNDDVVLSLPSFLLFFFPPVHIKMV